MIQLTITLEEAFTGCKKTIRGVPDPGKISGSDIIIDIPPGLSNGEQFKKIETPAATLIISVNILANYEVIYAGPFNVNDAGTIAKEVHVDVLTLMMGGSLEHTCIDGSTVRVHIPKSLHSGALLKLQGKGYWASYTKNKRGDCLLRVIADIKPLEEYPKEKLKEFQKHLESALNE
jgi:DnaJ-class molecular chaperone